jgi:PDZ domain-containing protein
LGRLLVSPVRSFRRCGRSLAARLRRKWPSLVAWAATVAVVFFVFWVAIPARLISVGPGPSPDVAALVYPADRATGVDVRAGNGHFLLTTVLATPATPVEFWKATVQHGKEIYERHFFVPVGMRDQTYLDWSLATMAESRMTAAWQAWLFLGRSAALVADGGQVFWVSAASPAAGLLQPGDLILSWSFAGRGEPFVTADEFEREIRLSFSDRPAGPQVSPIGLSLTVKRDGAPRTATISLSESGLKGWPFLGLAVGGRSVRTEPPVPVVFPTSEIGGASGGLMLALQIVDDFTPGDLTGGQIVAGSGTMEPDGSVGAVGGVAMKMLGAARAGATSFLVSSAGYEAATTAARELGLTLRLVPVSSLADACVILTGSQACVFPAIGDKGAHFTRVGRTAPAPASLTVGKTPDYNRADLRRFPSEQTIWTAVGP